MTAFDQKELKQVAIESAHAGANVAIESFRSSQKVERKSGKTDFVTQADRDAQRAIVEKIESNIPDATIYGEEGKTATAIPEEGVAWIVDPIDGTHNYVREDRVWATSVACVIDGAPVVSVNVLPALGDTYVGTPDSVVRNGEPVSVGNLADPELLTVVPTIWWPNDRRDEFGAAATGIVRRFGDLKRLGSAQAALSMLAAGTVDGVVTNVDTNPWDTVAGVGLVRWAGGTVTDLEGEDWSHDSRGLIASNGRAHDLLVELGQEIEAARNG